MSRTREKTAALATAGTAAAAAAGFGIKHLRKRNDVAQDSGAYRLLPGEPVGAGIRRVVAARVDHAIQQLQGDARPEPAEAIHETRKDIKKVRSALRLVRHQIGDDAWRRENEHFRSVARRLSSFRDAEILLEALEGVWERLEPDTRDRLGDLRQQLSDEKVAVLADGSAEEAMTLAAAELVAGRPRIDELELGGDGWKLIGPDLRRSYRRGRKCLAAAEESPTVENLHELRKRVKDIWYQLRLIRESDDEMIRTLADHAHDLADHLGDDHDLALLTDQVQTRTEAFASAEDRRELLDQIGGRRAELQFAAISLGRRIYAAKPKRFTGRLEKRWKVWREREPVGVT
jgi:CHAD domain-containing protein